MHYEHPVDRSGRSESPVGVDTHQAVAPDGPPALTFRFWRVALWSVTALIGLAILGSGAYVAHATRLTERAAAQRESRLAVDAFTEHTSQLLSHADALLHGMRWVYRRSGSLEETERYVDGLGFDRQAIGNLYLIGPQGNIRIAHSAAALNRDVSDREYFRFHLATPDDRPFVSTVERGRVTGDYYFRLSRRIDNPDGSFGGVALASIDPRSFARHFGALQLGTQSAVALLGTRDRKLRARLPPPSTKQWEQPIDSPLWVNLAQSPSGTYESASAVDRVRRLYTYRQVDSLPLVLVVGFSAEDVERRIAVRIGWLWPVATVVVLLCLVLTALADSLLRARERLAAAHRDLHAVYVQVRDLALFDPLTALPTRTLFADRLKRCLATAARHGLSCALLYLDLDDFKPINDNEGHEAGDAVLKLMGQRMCGAVRESDTVCRWGGDEFLILLPQPGSVAELLEVVARLTAGIAEPLALRGNRYRVSASVGVARFPDDGRTAETLQAAADAAMYEAKRRGKGLCVLASELTPAMLTKGRCGVHAA